MAHHREVLNQQMIFEKPPPIPFFNEDDFYGYYPSLLSPSRDLFGKKKQDLFPSHHMMMNPESTDNYFMKTNFYDPFKCEEPQMQYVCNDFIPRIITPVPDFAEVLRS
jgi:hypothetical protein